MDNVGYYKKDSIAFMQCYRIVLMVSKDGKLRLKNLIYGGLYFTNAIQR